MRDGRSPPLGRRRSASRARVGTLVHLFAAQGSPKFEPAAMKWLRRYLEESSPSLETFAKTVIQLAHEQDT